MRIFSNFLDFQRTNAIFLETATRQQVAVGNEGNKRQRLLAGWLAGRETLAEMSCLPFACVLYQTVLRMFPKRRQNYCIGPIIMGMPRERRQRRGRQSYTLISPLRVYHSFYASLLLLLLLLLQILTYSATTRTNCTHFRLEICRKFDGKILNLQDK